MKLTFSPVLNRRTALSSLGLAAWALCAGMASAQAVYPAHPITLVVPFPPGGSTDVVARAIAPKLGERLGATIVVDNRPGAGTAIGAAFVAKAAPDGYTLFLGPGSTLTLNPAIRKNLPYDSVKSFEPVGMVTRAGLLLLANAQEPVHNLADLKTAIKAAPDKYSYASFGAGTSSHFVGEMAFYAMGLKVTHIPYKGSAPAMTDLLGGQVPLAFDTVTATLPQLKTGKIRAIAVASSKRLSALPNVPTFAESGYPDVKLESWVMLLTPRGVAAPIKTKLQKALSDTLADAGVRKALNDQGLEPTFSSAADAAALIESELPLMRATAIRANIQAD